MQKITAASHGNQEGTWSMKIPLLLLSACALVAGFVPFTHFISADGKSFDSEVPFSFSALPVLFLV